MQRIARGGLIGALGIYLGIGVTIVIAGPVVFGAVSSRTEAGAAFATLLRATTWVDVGTGVAAAACAAAWLPRAPAGLRRTGVAVALALMLGGIGYYKFGITPAMQAHRRHIATFDTANVDVHRAAFDALHHRYVRVYSASLLAALAAAVLAVSLPDGAAAATEAPHRFVPAAPPKPAA